MAPITDMFLKPWSPRFKWLATCSTVYAVAAIVAICFGFKDWTWLIQMVWVAIMSMPLWVRPLKTKLKMDKPIPKDQW